MVRCSPSSSAARRVARRRAPRSPLALASAVLLVATAAPPAGATWSIVLGDEATREVAVGTVTCLDGQDLLAIVPVIVVERGAAAVQAFADYEGTRRPLIFDELAAGRAPEDILDMLREIPGHPWRQYGIVDTQGRAVTETGDRTDDWTGGATGTIGSLRYAVQGNVLAGSCVVPAIEAALAAPGDLPTRLMQGMVAARAAGGDGRCTCSLGAPTSCGCPPVPIDKAGHIGGMIVARAGDRDDARCDVDGCADGDYFMRLNVAFQDPDDADPVVQLQTKFDAWRQGLVHRPDAIASGASFDPPFIPPNGVATTTMTICIDDWRGRPVLGPLRAVEVVHGADSDGISTIGNAVLHGDGTASVVLTAGSAHGLDRLRVTIDDGVRPVTLMPDPALRYYALGDIDGDGRVGAPDLVMLLASWGPCDDPPARCPADVSGNGAVDLVDLLALLFNWS